jgi:hypothetical protein
LLTFEQRPLFKRRAVAGETVEEFTAIQGDWNLEIGGWRLEYCLLGQGGNIKEMVALRVELDRIARDAQKGRIGVVVSDDVTEIGKRVAEIVERGTIGEIGPEQARERFARMRTLTFDSKVREEGANFVRLKARKRATIQRRLKRSEQRQSQARHSFPS